MEWSTIMLLVLFGGLALASPFLITYLSGRQSSEQASLNNVANNWWFKPLRGIIKVFGVDIAPDVKISDTIASAQGLVPYNASHEEIMARYMAGKISLDEAQRLTGMRS